MGLGNLDRTKAGKFQNSKKFGIQELEEFQKDLDKINRVNNKINKIVGRDKDADDQGISNKLLKELGKQYSDKEEDESIVISVQNASKYIDNFGIIVNVQGLEYPKHGKQRKKRGKNPQLNLE